MTIPQSILIGSVIIGGCIVGTQFAAPYRLASGTAVVWRLNAVTGEIKLCNSDIEYGKEIEAGKDCR
jgi:hypothetical protein